MQNGRPVAVDGFVCQQCVDDDLKLDAKAAATTSDPDNDNATNGTEIRDKVGDADAVMKAHETVAAGAGKPTGAVNEDIKWPRKPCKNNCSSKHSF